MFLTAMLLLLQLLVVFRYSNAELTEHSSAHSLYESFAVPAIPESENLALYSLYNATQGPSWVWNSTTVADIPWDFSGSSDLCIDHWQGVTCAVTASTSRVSGISLES